MEEMGGQGFFGVAGGKGKLTWLQSVTGPLNAWLLLCLSFLFFLLAVSIFCENGLIMKKMNQYSLG